MNVLQLKNSSFKGFETHNRTPLMEKIIVGSKNAANHKGMEQEF